MLKDLFITGFGCALLMSTFGTAQQTQTGPPAQTPTDAIYNRMRRFPNQAQAGQQQQQTTQTQQFPSPAQQFPPDQQGAGVPQRPGMRFPHGEGPPQQPQSPQPQPNPQPTGSQPAANQQPSAPYGRALQPSNPPRISYAGGQLTVTADNSSLPEILNGVMKATGARLDGNRPADSERVFGQFGPGTPRDVLNSLLTGSRYDYILVGALDDPGRVQQVMLSPHGSSLANVASAQNRNQPEQPNEDEDSNETVVAQPILATEPPSPPTQVNPPPEPNPGQQQVKTPEQLLQELQRLRQQQQQQQQTPNSPR